MRTTTLLFTFAGLTLSAGCHSAPPQEKPAPEPTQAEIARRRQVQDSLDAASRLAADSAARAREVESAERSRADSAEQMRLAAERAARVVADSVTRRSNALRDELASVIHFDVAEARIQPEGLAALDRKAAILEANPQVRLQVTGACDERGSDQYNMALGQRRAAAAARYLVGKGIDAARLDLVSAGEQSPVDTGTDEAAWARNRRAEFVIASGDAPLAMK